jgi:hypothetical protein
MVEKQFSVLKMETAGFSEMSAYFYWTTQCYMAQYSSSIQELCLDEML